MDDVEGVDMNKALENLAEEPPDFLRLLGQVAGYQVSKGLVSVSFDPMWEK
jgi:hypothetical protein